MRSAKNIAIIALMSATLTGGKMAMSVLPNIEPVTILIALYASVFGLSFALPATFVFVTLEIFIYGMNTWVILYYIYWPLVAIIFSLVNKKQKPLWVNLITVFVLTLFFGVLSSLIDVGLFMGAFDNLWYRFGVMYARGIVFFVVHIVSNLAIFAVGFNPLRKVLFKIKNQLLQNDNLA